MSSLKDLFPKFVKLSVYYSVTYINFYSQLFFFNLRHCHIITRSCYLQYNWYPISDHLVEHLVEAVTEYPSLQNWGKCPYLKRPRTPSLYISLNLYFTGIVFTDLEKETNQSAFPETIRYKIRMDSEKVPPTDTLHSM